MSWAKSLVLRLAKVPDQPHIPEGSAESVLVFNAGRKYWLFRLIMWMLGNIGTALILLVAFAISLNPTMPHLLHTIWLTVWTIGVTVFLISIPVTFFLQRLNFEMRWYIVSDRSLRIRSGVVWLQEMTMTFANIQGIRVTAGPMERLLGLANVVVESAGGGGKEPGGSGHIAEFEGVDTAEAIRDLLVERLRVYRDSGLGETTVEHHEPPSLLAAREVLVEAKALRSALAKRSH